MIIDYETKVADPTLSESLRDAYRRYLETHRRAAEQRATEIAQMPKTPIISTLTQTPIGYIEPTQDVPRGIINPNVGGKVGGSAFDAEVGCTNMWQDVLGPLLVQVYACYTKADPGLARLVVDTYPMDIEQAPPGMLTRTGYATPQAVGPVRIIAAQGTLLTLQNDDQSATFYFDVAARQYVNNLGTPVALTPSTTQVVATPQIAP
jgi:hypothetical protein